MDITNIHITRKPLTMTKHVLKYLVLLTDPS